MLKDFREFIARGNVIDLAVAVVIGAAFGRIVTALVDGVIMPPIGMLTGGIDFGDLYLPLRDLSAYEAAGGVRLSLDQVKELGIPVIAYGQLINEIVTFLIVAFVIFVLVRQYNQLKRQPPPASPTTKACPYCLTTVPLAATKCSACTSTLA